jgi:hypothetical protein
MDLLPKPKERNNQMNKILIAYIIGLLVGAGAFYVALEIILK